MKCERLDCGEHAVAYHGDEALCPKHWLEANRERQQAEALWRYLEADLLAEMMRPPMLPTFCRQTSRPGAPS